MQNQRGESLSCIIFIRDVQKLPTLLYLHGNGGHKMEGLPLVEENHNLVAFDFAGCGRSDG